VLLADKISLNSGKKGENGENRVYTFWKPKEKEGNERWLGWF
jgi:hypothetical protein